MTATPLTGTRAGTTNHRPQTVARLNEPGAVSDRDHTGLLYAHGRSQWMRVPGCGRCAGSGGVVELVGKDADGVRAKTPCLNASVWLRVRKLWR
jgi:hypothetical protein